MCLCMKCGSLKDASLGNISSHDSCRQYIITLKQATSAKHSLSLSPMICATQEFRPSTQPFNLSEITDHDVYPQALSCLILLFGRHRSKITGKGIKLTRKQFI